MSSLDRPKIELKPAAGNKPAVVMQCKDEEQCFDTTGKAILKDTENAVQKEHEMSLRDAIRKYPQAIFWSSWFSAAVIMEGFDHSFISGFISFPAFQKRYGVEVSPGEFEIPAEMQSGISNGTQAGEIIGLLICGLLVDRFGSRWIMIACLFLLICFVFLQFFAANINMYLGAEILLGVPWGAFQSLTNAYAVEVCPGTLRSYLTMLVSMFWSIGYLIGTGVLRGFLGMTTSAAYKIPFALQWVFPVPLIIGIYFAPESPWWYIRKGRRDDAEKSLRRLRSKKYIDDGEISETLAMMEYTYQIEAEMKQSSTYWDLFKGVDLRRTEICIWTYSAQVWCAALVAYIVYFLEEAGLPDSASFDFGMGEYALAIVGVFVAFYFVPRVGRRRLLLSGILFMVVTTFVIGFLGIPGTTNHPALAYAIGSILLVEYFVYFISIGPVVYTIVAEIPSNTLRSKTIVVARATYNTIALIKGQILPRMISTASWNWGAKMAFFWGAFMLMILIWVYYRLPETKDRAFVEIDILFKNKVSARDFKKAQVNLTSESVEKP
ncbi:uncharacterized protein N7503_000548 [Penicillium pulvis]|uniref:uncharacterized protein n=1 Tax=Penicillium pulvis TaxID=1562058 RepID=UPI002548F833|nr:uncharacterized protein N7503_000548 [Penicillium pulvis]KAJ5813798.1 hypothetical protein N7503_000548 [Penicillium pulvis]